MNYPNPFNPSTTINYLIEEKSNIKLSIHNIKGQKVIELIHCNKDRGKHSVIWDGKNSSGETINSGVYYIILNADNKRVIIKKCVLLK